MIPRIVVPLDGSRLAEQVLSYVKILGRPTQVPILLLEAIESTSSNLAVVVEGLSSRQLSEIRRNQAQSYLEKTAASLRREGLAVATEVVEGHPASCIVSVAEQGLGSLIAMSTHGRSGLARWALGSITDKVLHATANPLLIVRTQKQEDFRLEVKLTHLLVPLDGSALAEQVLPLAASLAKDLGLKVTLLRVTPSIEDYYQFADYPPATNFDDLAAEADDEAITYLTNTARRLQLVEGVQETETWLAHGRPEIAITDYVRELPHCLVAMTTHGRSGMGRWMLGSVADRVIRHSGVPVLVVRSSEQGK